MGDSACDVLTVLFMTSTIYQQQPASRHADLCVVQLNTLLWETPTNAKKKKKKAQTSEKPEAQLCDISFRVTEQILQSVCVRECVCVRAAVQVSE